MYYSIMQEGEALVSSRRDPPGRADGVEAGGHEGGARVPLPERVLRAARGGRARLVRVRLGPRAGGVRPAAGGARGRAAGGREAAGPRRPLPARERRAPQALRGARRPREARQSGPLGRRAHLQLAAHRQRKYVLSCLLAYALSSGAPPLLFSSSPFTLARECEEALNLRTSA